MSAFYRIQILIKGSNCINNDDYDNSEKVKKKMLKKELWSHYETNIKNPKKQLCLLCKNDFKFEKVKSVL